MHSRYLRQNNFSLQKTLGENWVFFVLKKYNIVSLSNNTADACGMAHVAKAYHQFTSGLATKDSFVKYEWEVIKKMTKDSVITTPYTLEGIEPKKIKKKKSL